MLATEEKIIQASLSLFARKGFEATSIRDIANEAKINTSTLYYYINNKEDILIGIMKSGLERLIAYGSEMIDGLESPVERIASLVQLHVMAHGVNRLSALVTDTEFRALHGANKEKVRKLRKQYEMLWSHVIKEGIRNRLFPNIRDEKIATFAILEMCTGVVHWYSPNGRLSLLEISRHFADMVLNLLGAEMDGKKVQVNDLMLPDPTKYYDPERIEYDINLEVLKK